MKTNAVSRELNIRVTMGNTETAQYGVPTAFQGRFNAISGKVFAVYRAMFGLEVNMYLPDTGYVVRSELDTCQAGNYPTGTRYDGYCTHTVNSDCAWNGNSSDAYHHSNCDVLHDTLYPHPYSTNYIDMHITAARMCVYENGQHLKVYGVRYNGCNTILVRDSDHVRISNVGLGDTTHFNWVTATIIHEIGHIYGVEDHYETPYNDSRDNCIWGYNKDTSAVVSTPIICSDCRQTILSNAD